MIDMTQLPGDAAMVLDASHLGLMTGHDVELAVEILGLFLVQAEDVRPRLVISEAPKVWADAAHALKGAALGTGAMALASACGHAEALGRSGHVPLAQVKKALAAVLERLDEARLAAECLAQDLELRGGTAFSETAYVSSNTFIS